MAPVLKIDNLDKSFHLHQQGGVADSGVRGLLGGGRARVRRVAVTGPSGRGKSSLLKLIYGTYRATGGSDPRLP